MKPNLTKVQTFILSVIRMNNGIQNDDAELIATVWALQGWDYSDSLYANLKKVTNPETITRARRKLHELGYITYSKDADAAREKNYIQMRYENSHHNMKDRFNG